MIRRLDAEGVSKAQIARRLGISRTTVTKAVASDRPPEYRRTPVETSFVMFEPRVRALLRLTPDMPATVLAERVGWKGSITWFRQNVKRIRVEYLPADPSDRLEWLAGDAAQCDLWFPPRKIGLEDGTARLLPVLVMTCAHSRFTLGRMIPTRTTEDLLLGMWSLLQHLGRVPRRLIWENEAGIGRGKGLADGGAGFAGTLANKYGRRRVMVIAAVLFLIAAIGQAFPLGVADLMFWRFIGGAGIGIASVIAPMYIAEIAPAQLRGRLGSLQQLAIVLGIFTTAVTNYLILNAASAGKPETSANNTWIFGLEAWQWMFLVMIIPALVYGLLALTIPESPRYLVSVGQD